ncbi:hypothetical protein [Bosea minatitlanensis]|uniref:Uncharacterized protein n=1 Tax=Bosea minatitlanensis TaxID=128782 RepID=A0ABW0EYI9_9HYPH|nr:hypothetical protein [Bosea minatitlanensis]MCT4491768.1 hypothetical protein [Bosea minatitlanensis]
MPKLRIDDRPHGPAHYWKVMRQLGFFTAADVHGRSNGASRGSVIRYVRACAEAGYCESIGERRSQKGRPMPLYKMVETRRLTAPTFHVESDRGRRQQQLWNAAKALKSFTAKELAITASTDSVAVSLAMSCQYCTRLASAGYLWIEQERQPRRYRINPARISGPLAPSFHRNSSVGIDRNLRQPVNLNESERS